MASRQSIRRQTRGLMPHEAVRISDRDLCPLLRAWDERPTIHRSDQMADAFITLEQAGVLLGGTERPFSRYTVEKLIRLGRLKDNGGTRKLRRVSRASVEALIREVE